jgi:hypothetical protein
MIAKTVIALLLLTSVVIGKARVARKGIITEPQFLTEEIKLSASELAKVLATESIELASLCPINGMIKANSGGYCKCGLGGHSDGQGNCSSNFTNCDTYNVVSGKCVECSFWYWKNQNAEEGVWCENKWWFWVASGMGSFLFMMVLFTAFNYASHKNAYEEMKVQELYISGYEESVGTYH